MSLVLLDGKVDLLRQVLARPLELDSAVSWIARSESLTPGAIHERPPPIDEPDQEDEGRAHRVRHDVGDLEHVVLRGQNHSVMEVADQTQRGAHDPHEHHHGRRSRLSTKVFTTSQ